MRKFIYNNRFVVLSSVLGMVASLSIARCGSSSSGTTLKYVQIERLARPAINEGLVTQHGLLNAFNSVAPSVDLTAAAAPVVANAANTLIAFYSAVCFLKGVLSLGDTTLQALTTCPATGASILGADGKVTSNAAFMGTATSGTTVGTGALGYATLVAGQFLPDVLRIDTTIDSGYFTAPGLCNGGAAGSPLLCGGRKLDDPVIDITFAYLLNGGNVVRFLQGTATAGQPFIAPISNGVFFNAGVSPLGNGDSTGNKQQGHAALIGAGLTFPYSANPY